VTEFASGIESLQDLRCLPSKVLFIFLDGVGLAPPGPGNPLSCVPMPHLRELLGGPLALGATNGQAVSSPDLVLRQVDACLGVPGLPQSATGQTALFTGVNAPALVGDHVTAYPTASLRSVIAEQSVLKQAADGGGRVLFANAHSEHFWQMVREGKRRLGASTLAALAAGAPIPTLDDLLMGQAVLWDITHEVAGRYLGYELPLVPAREAGARLARLALDYELVLYESFLTDLAGHGRIEPEWVLPRIDEFLGGVLAHIPSQATLVLCSDHGNLEDTTTRAHTTNPVPLVAAGPAAKRFCQAKAITDVAPAILDVLRTDGEFRVAG
jgi:2,3-bisphosphoglycerate-independent phosphoglycerate mutase